MEKKSKQAMDELNVEQLELKGFARSIAEIEWLLLLLVLLYFMSPEANEIIEQQEFGLRHSDQ